VTSQPRNPQFLAVRWVPPNLSAVNLLFPNIFRRLGISWEAKRLWYISTSFEGCSVLYGSTVIWTLLYLRPTQDKLFTCKNLKAVSRSRQVNLNLPPSTPGRYMVHTILQAKVLWHYGTYTSSSLRKTIKYNMKTILSSKT